MKTTFATLFLSALLAAAMAAGNGTHNDTHSDSHYACGCAAQSLGFTIDCADGASVTAAMAYLDANCTTKESCHIEDPSGGHDGHDGHDDHRRRRSGDGDPMCQKSWGILSSHHDHCLADDILKNEEVKFHTYLDLCGAACEISRKYDPKLSACPTFECTAANANAVVSALQNGGCASACTSNACADAYKKIRYLHDACDDVKAVEEIVGEPIHDYEESCEEAGHGCNTATASTDVDPNVCSSAYDVTTSLVLVAATIAVLML